MTKSPKELKQTATTLRWLVNVFTPGGHPFYNIECNSRSAAAAILFARKKVYKMGKLAHFYLYIANDRKIQ